MCLSKVDVKHIGWSSSRNACFCQGHLVIRTVAAEVLGDGPHTVEDVRYAYPTGDGREAQARLELLHHGVPSRLAYFKSDASLE